MSFRNLLEIIHVRDFSVSLDQGELGALFLLWSILECAATTTGSIIRCL